MLRILPLAALLTLGFAGGVPPAPVQPAWTIKDVVLERITASGELVTRPLTDQGWGAPLLERRALATRERLGQVVLPEAGNELGMLAITPDLGAAAWLNRTGEVLTVRTPTRRWTASTPGLRGTRFPVFSPDGRTLVIPNENGYVQLWDVTTGQRRATLLLHSRPDGLAFHPDGEVLAINERSWGESSVTLWNLDTGKQVGRVPGLTGVQRVFQFAPDGTLVVPVAPYTVGWVDPETGRVLRKLPTFIEPCPPGGPFTRCARGAFGASLSADGGRILVDSAARRGTDDVAVARLYDAASGKLLGTFDTPRAFASLSPDGGTLILNTFQGELQGLRLP